MGLGSDQPKEACGVAGVYAPGEQVSKLIYFMLYALQHRGQESAGIAVSEGDVLVVVKEMGLVAQVFDENTLSSLTGGVGIGHVRYSTTGSSLWDNAQPIYRAYGGLTVALGHNGNLVNTLDIARDLEAFGAANRTATTDSDLIAELIVRSGKETVEQAILDTLPKLKGAFTLVMMDEKKIFGARDPHGLRPLVIGRLASGGWVLASETCALDNIGATVVREVEPGELVVIDEDGIHSHRYAEATPKLCIFEFVYFARPDSNLYGRNVQMTRFRMGQRLAQEAPADADLVMPVPDSGRGAAAGFAQASGIPYGDGLVKNAYVGRTFIEPTQMIREQGIRTKLNPMAEMIEGKRLVVVDDSIVRGNTTRQIVKMLRDAGALEVHMRISSPPIKWPCFYGIDTANRDELIAAWKSVDEIARHIGADSLSYLSTEGMVAATEVSADMFCTACFSNEYPIPIPDEVKVTKHMLEGIV
ncbi:MAG TPA: amidophosphoribosyltransferase [Actinomycetota bacterium]|nr:amidophosphoribosyltransferase [Actinomycetota bacterium]